MATMLEVYTAYKNSFESSMQTAMPDPSGIWRQQELLYRIEVLEVCQMFVKTSPRNCEPKALFWHYQMVDAYFQNLSAERKFGTVADEQLQKQRVTAHENLMKVIQDYRKRFSSFVPGGDADCYRKTIGKVIQTVLPVWVQYRQTYIEIPKEAV